MDFGLCSFRLPLAIMQEPCCVFSSSSSCMWGSVCQCVCVEEPLLGLRHVEGSLLYYTYKQRRRSVGRPPKASPRPCRKRTTTTEHTGTFFGKIKTLWGYGPEQKEYQFNVFFFITWMWLNNACSSVLNMRPTYLVRSRNSVHLDTSLRSNFWLQALG